MKFVGEVGADNSADFVVEVPSEETAEFDDLTDEQRHGAELAISGTSSILLTGAAGTGKSFLLRYIIKELLARNRSGGVVAVTATTGIASTHIDGQTLHSFAGIGYGKGSAEELLGKIQRNDSTAVRWKQTRYLIVDEVSMLDSKLFDKLEYIARGIKQNSLPFGGICLVLCGDFFQLPPVTPSKFEHRFAFESQSWKRCNIHILHLQQVHRQGNDMPFVDILNQVRLGTLSLVAERKLATCCIDLKPLPNDGIQPTKLYCLNRDVDKENSTHLSALEGELSVFPARDTWIVQPLNGKVEEKAKEGVERKGAVSELRMKINAQVLLTRNMRYRDDGLVNGSRGVVERFELGSMNERDGLRGDLGTTTLCPVVRFDIGKTFKIYPVATRSGVGPHGQDGMLQRMQFPLKLAWAMTVHKSQGMTVTRAELMLERSFECGQVYVALSRVKELKGLWIRGPPIKPNIVRAHPSVLKFFGMSVPPAIESPKFFPPPQSATLVQIPSAASTSATTTVTTTAAEPNLEQPLPTPIIPRSHPIHRSSTDGQARLPWPNNPCTEQRQEACVRLLEAAQLSAPLLRHIGPGLRRRDQAPAQLLNPDRAGIDKPPDAQCQSYSSSDRDSRQTVDGKQKVHIMMLPIYNKRVKLLHDYSGTAGSTAVATAASGLNMIATAQGDSSEIYNNNHSDYTALSACGSTSCAPSNNISRSTEAPTIPAGATVHLCRFPCLDASSSSRSGAVGTSAAAPMFPETIGGTSSTNGSFSSPLATAQEDLSREDYIIHTSTAVVACGMNVVSSTFGRESSFPAEPQAADPPPAQEVEPMLSPELRARIERNRQEALDRRRRSLDAAAIHVPLVVVKKEVKKCK